MDHSELIKKLESATEGNRILSWEFALSMGWKTDYTRNKRPWQSPDGKWFDLPPDYTQSVDAAIAAVPLKLPLDIHVGPHRRYTDATVHEPVMSMDEQNRRVTTFIPHTASAIRDGTIVANTPALAICIAVLKYLMKTGEQNA